MQFYVVFLFNSIALYQSKTSCTFSFEIATVLAAGPKKSDVHVPSGPNSAETKPKKKDTLADQEFNGLRDLRHPSKNDSLPKFQPRRYSRRGLLIKERPDLAAEYNQEKNEVPLQLLTCGSGKKAWWTCAKCSYEWQAGDTSVARPHENIHLLMIFSIAAN